MLQEAQEPARVAKMNDKLISIEKNVISIQVSLRWHKRLILALYALLGMFMISSVSTASFTGLSVLSNQEVIRMDWTIFQPLLVVLAALGRSILGWAKVSFKDGYLQDFEIKKLGETVVRVGLLGAVIAYLPWIDVSWIEVSAVALGGDLLLNAVKKRRTSETA